MHALPPRCKTYLPALRLGNHERLGAKLTPQSLVAPFPSRCRRASLPECRDAVTPQVIRRSTIKLHAVLAFFCPLNALGAQGDVRRRCRARRALEDIAVGHLWGLAPRGAISLHSADHMTIRQSTFPHGSALQRPHKLYIIGKLTPGRMLFLLTGPSNPTPSDAAGPESAARGFDREGHHIA